MGKFSGSWQIKLLAFALFVTLPFVYNACNKGGGFQPLNSLQCSKFAKREPRSNVFANRKLVLHDDLAPSSSRVVLKKDFKVESDETLEPGAELSILLDRDCLLQQSVNNGNLSPFVREILGSRGIKSYVSKPTYTYRLKNAIKASEIEAKLAAEPCILGAGRSQTYKTASLYNDPWIPYQTHLQMLEADTSYVSFFNASYGIKPSGSQAVIAFIDSGVDWQHPDLAPNMWTDPATGFHGLDATSVCANCLISFNPFDVSPEGHGTHVAGLAAALGNNAFDGQGVMPFGVKIMAIRVVDPNLSDKDPSQHYIANSATIADGIQFAIDNGADVINMSLQQSQTCTGQSSCQIVDPIYKQKIDDAIDSGIFVAVAMGNTSPQGRSVDGVNFSVVPAMYAASRSGMIAVGSVNATRDPYGNILKSDFSNFSPVYAEIAAPGATQDAANGVYSTLPTSIAAGGIGQMAGTSQATPLVAGAAALVISWYRQTYGVSPAPSTVKDLLLASSIQNSNLASYFKNGATLNLRSLSQTMLARYPEIMGGSTSLSSTSCP